MGMAECEFLMRLACTRAISCCLYLPCPAASPPLATGHLLRSPHSRTWGHHISHVRDARNPGRSEVGSSRQGATRRPIAAELTATPFTPFTYTGSNGRHDPTGPQVRRLPTVLLTQMQDCMPTPANDAVTPRPCHVLSIHPRQGACQGRPSHGACSPDQI